MNNVHDTENFKTSEFACHCCGENKINQSIINLCQSVREKVGTALRVNSGYRCPKHNAEVGGVKNSYHAQGLAADLSGSCGAAKIFQAVKELYENDKEFHDKLGYAIYYHKKNFVHIDAGAKRKSGNVFEERR